MASPSALGWEWPVTVDHFFQCTKSVARPSSVLQNRGSLCPPPRRGAGGSGANAIWRSSGRDVAMSRRSDIELEYSTTEWVRHAKYAPPMSSIATASALSTTEKTTLLPSASFMLRAVDNVVKLGKYNSPLMNFLKSPPLWDSRACVSVSLSQPGACCTIQSHPSLPRSDNTCATPTKHKYGLI